MTVNSQNTVRTKDKPPNEVKHKNSNYFLPFGGASVDGLYDGVKRAPEVAAKDCLKVVFVPDFVLTPSVGYDVCTAVGTE